MALSLFFHFRFIFDDRGLTITETKVTDKAIYECIASNLAGDESKVITLIIESKYRQSWGRLHANVIDYNYNYFEIS